MEGNGTLIPIGATKMHDAHLPAFQSCREPSLTKPRSIQKKNVQKYPFRDATATSLHVTEERNVVHPRKRALALQEKPTSISQPLLMFRSPDLSKCHVTTSWRLRSGFLTATLEINAIGVGVAAPDIGPLPFQVCSRYLSDKVTEVHIETGEQAIQFGSDWKAISHSIATQTKEPSVDSNNN
ncbi:hypothetical protein EAG_10663 [Camponotus floridanus]|uniref:Uncharacterized protein n=1 Tax=Camponotus floridanus TaxID=104421 RepID=E2A602_CAMFO|nr:hypothetical protein EAG_10663 [Camponotus floridanus]